jgi:uncharacterized protein (TIGR02265 family)
MKADYLAKHRQSSVPPPPRSEARPSERRLSTLPQAPAAGGTLIGLSGARFEVRIPDLLRGNVDIDAVAEALPPSYTIKGMFFAALVKQLGDHFLPVAPRLSSPPRKGAYVPFSDYPARDFLWIYDAAAQLAHPSRGAREAYRRLARQLVAVYAQSAVGKITMSLSTDPGTALINYPSSFGLLAKGPTAQAWHDGPNAVRLNIINYYGLTEYPLGICEELVSRFGAAPTISVVIYAHNALELLVRW